MPKIDKVNKEIDLIKSLLFLLLAIFISIVVGLIARYDKNAIDIIFWIGVTLEPLILFASIKVTKLLMNKMKELEGL